MNLIQYHQIILDKLKSGNFTIKQKKEFNLNTADIKPEMLYLEAIHYLMYEWCVDHQDSRFREIFDYICIPNDVNKGKVDIDFTQWDFKTFMENLIKLKN